MLDSLVRVSRRVGGAADLLATEMRAVPVMRHSLYEPAQLPADGEASNAGLGTPEEPTQTSPAHSVHRKRFVA